MFKSAQLYKEELNQRYIETWYQPKYMYYSGVGNREISIADNNFDRHDFVCVNDKGKVTGYFSYHINWITKSIDSFGLISFINNNIILINDVIKHLTYLLYHVGINRIEFWAYADNPAVDGYEKLVKKFGGERIATLHQVEMLSDGKLHDMCVFEILHKNSEIARKHFLKDSTNTH